MEAAPVPGWRCARSGFPTANLGEREERPHAEEERKPLIELSQKAFPHTVIEDSPLPRTSKGNRKSLGSHSSLFGHVSFRRSHCLKAERAKIYHAIQARVS